MEVATLRLPVPFACGQICIDEKLKGNLARRDDRRVRCKLKRYPDVVVPKIGDSREYLRFNEPFRASLIQQDDAGASSPSFHRQSAAGESVHCRQRAKARAAMTIGV
jgi:hypothetical protein